MTKQADAVQMTVTGTPGTGDVTLNAPTPNNQSFASGGVVNGDIVRVRFDDGTSFEVSQCVYSSTGPKLTGRTVIEATGGVLLSLSSATIASLVSTAHDNPDPILHALAGGI